MRGAAGPWIFFGMSQGAGCFRPLCLSVAQATTLLWLDCGDPSLVGQVVLVRKSHQQLPEMLVPSRSEGGVLKEVLKALFSAWAARYCGLPEQAEPLSLALACCLLLF